jgi:hypothetical protein
MMVVIKMMMVVIMMMVKTHTTQSPVVYSTHDIDYMNIYEITLLLKLLVTEKFTQNILDTVQ